MVPGRWRQGSRVWAWCLYLRASPGSWGSWFALTWPCLLEVDEAQCWTERSQMPSGVDLSRGREVRLGLLSSLMPATRESPSPVSLLSKCPASPFFPPHCHKPNGAPSVLLGSLPWPPLGPTASARPTTPHHIHTSLKYHPKAQI